MHSLPFIVPVLAAVILYGWKTNRLRVAVAYSVGHLLHPFGDFYGTMLAGSVPRKLFWPFVSFRPGVDPVWIHDWTVFSAVILAIVSLLFVADLRKVLAHTKSSG
jgi:hypothetical protein